jgi:hypothetical protein
MATHGAQHVPNWESLDVSEPPPIYSTGNRDAERFRQSFRTQAMFSMAAAETPARETGSPKKSLIKTLSPQGLYNSKEKLPEKFLGELSDRNNASLSYLVYLVVRGTSPRLSRL